MTGIIIPRNTRDEVSNIVAELKECTFTDLLTAINEKRKKTKTPKTRMSPTTLNKYLKILVNNGSIIRIQKTHKDVHYEPSKYTKFEISIMEIEELLEQVRTRIKETVDKAETQFKGKTFGEFLAQLDKISYEYSPHLIDLIAKTHDLLFELIQPSFPIAIGFIQQKGKRHMRLIPMNSRP